MFRSLLLSSALITAAFSSTLAQAQDAQFLRHKASSCSARSIDEYYCPDFSNYWQGPYFDNGCSVTCKSGQTATCREAHCEETQTGQSIDSKCSCK